MPAPTPFAADDTLPIVLLPAAIPDDGFATAAQIAEVARLPGLAALATAAVETARWASDAPTPAELGHEHWLRQRTAMAAAESAGACTALCDGPGAGAWRIDPVHLHLGMDHVLLTDPARLALAADEAQALSDAIAPRLAEDGLALQAPVPSRWYLSPHEPSQDLRLAPRSLLAAVGRSIEAYLPVGEDTRRWKRLLNEIQMTWFDHPVNLARESQGLPVVNGLWLEGRCPASTPLTEAIGRLQVGAAPNTEQLALEPALLQARLSGDARAWVDAWRSLDPMLAACAARQGRFAHGARLILAGDAGWREVRIEPRGRKVASWWPFGRRRADPAALLTPPAAAT